MFTQLFYYENGVLPISSSASPSGKALSSVNSPESVRPHSTVHSPQQQLCGFVWADNSCAFDSLVTPLFYLYHALPNNLKESFLFGMKGVSECFRYFEANYERFVHGEENSWDSIKDILLSHCLNSPFMKSRRSRSDFNPNAFVTAVEAWSSLLSYERGPEGLGNECFYLIHRDEPECHTCEDIDALQEIPIWFLDFHTSDLNLANYQGSNVQSLVTAFEFAAIDFHRECPVCDRKPIIIHKRIYQSPTILFMTIEGGGYNCLTAAYIDQVVIFNSNIYHLFAAIYCNDNHFITRFRPEISKSEGNVFVRGNVLEYDGALLDRRGGNGVPSRLVLEDVKFPCKIHRNYVVTNMIYVNYSRVSASAVDQMIYD